MGRLALQTMFAVLSCQRSLKVSPTARELYRMCSGGHMFKKVWQGSVQLLQLAGSKAPLGAEVLPNLDLRQLLTLGPPFPAHVLWDIAAAVAAEEQGELEEGSGSVLALMQVLCWLLSAQGLLAWCLRGSLIKTCFSACFLGCLVCRPQGKPINSQ